MRKPDYSVALAALRHVDHAHRVVDGSLWNARAENAQLVTAGEIPQLSGATRFEVDIFPVDGCDGPPALCFDFGNGFEEAGIQALSHDALSSRPLSAIVELDKPPKRIRIDVCAQPGHFFCSELRVGPVHETSPPEGLRVAALLDLSRVELWPQMAQYLSHIADLERLYVCLPDDGADAVVEAIAARYPRAILRRLSEDESGAAACLEMLDLAAEQGADLVCFLHTRPSPHVQGTDEGRWDITHKLAGSTAIVEDILASFRDDPTLGMVGPAGHVLPAAYHRDLDADRVRDCSARLGADEGGLDTGFVAGSMFWARIDALRPLRRLRERMHDLARLPEEGAIATPLDRCLPGAAAARGFRVAETRVPDSATKSALDFAPRGLLDTPPPSSVPDALDVTLTPLAGLEAIDNTAGAWRAVHNDPQFLIEGLAAHAARWVHVDMELRAAFSANQPSIHFDFGSGWTEHGAVGLARPEKDNGFTSTTVCCLPPGVQRARLDPVAHPGRFELTRFEVRPLTVVQAIEHMGRALEEQAPGPVLERLYPAYVSALALLDTSYANWVRHYEVPREEYGRLAVAQAAWRDPPKFSLFVDARGADPAALIASVIGQLYPHWELWIGHDGSLKAHARADSRIRMIDVRGMSLAAAVNAALERAAGAFFGVLNVADALHPLALHYMAEAALAHPGCALVYSDEDRVGVEGARHQPWFKCELNYELLLAMDMFSRLACYGTHVMREAGGMREGFEGAEGHDLALRVVERVQGGQVAHVPRVLCHIGDAGDRGAVAGEASRRAVGEHLARAGLAAAEVVQAPDAPPGVHRVRFAVPEPAPEVCIVIPTRDRADLLRTCVEAILARTTYAHYGIVIVDNGSREESTRELLDQYRAKGITVIRDDSEFNYSALNNRAVAATSAEYVCLMNNDIEVVTPGWLEEMVAMAARPGVGAVGARLWYPDRRVQHAGLVLGIAGIVGYAHKFLSAGEPGYACRAVVHQSFSALTAACLVMRRDIYEKAGGLDERLAVSFNDVDFCLRLRDAGYRNVWTPYAEAIHAESSSRGPESTPEKSRRLQQEIDLFRSRWASILESDPAYSPNLTLDAEDFSLAWPPRVGVSPIIGAANTNSARTEP